MTDEGEELNGVPVLLDEPLRAEPAPRPPAGALSPVVVQTAAVVGVSVVAGAAVMAVAQRRKARRIARRQRGLLGPVLASRSFLVDVHVLGDRK